MNPYFKPTDAENEVIDFINNYNFSEFAIIRMTSTMIDKSIIDASAEFRKMLLDNDLIDFQDLIPGGEKYYKKTIIISDNIFETKTSFYRPQTKQGDPRFWVYDLKKYTSIGELVYLTISDKQLVIIPIKSIESIKTSLNIVFEDLEKNETVIQLKGRLELLKTAGFIESVSLYNRAPKDVGMTLERFLDVKVNSLKTPDYLGKIELKSKRDDSKKDSLFSKVQDKDISKYKTVKEVIIKFGYYDEVNNRIALYNNIISKPNNQGLYLLPDNNNLILYQKYMKEESVDDVCAWHYHTLQKALETKHPTTLWVDAEEKVIDNKIHFEYRNFVLTTKPVFAEFISLIDRDLINFDWKGHVKDGKKRDHGPGFRIDKQNRKYLFKTLINVD